MNSDDLKTRAQALRAAGNTPKQIARTLGIPRSQAVSLLHSSPSPRPPRPLRTPLPAPITLAQDLILGAVDYAAALGFDPHRDFYLAKPHLGTWQPPSRIQFGLQGRPYFQQGPYDNPTRIMRTLDRSVGPGNYGYTANITTSHEP